MSKKNMVQFSPLEFLRVILSCPSLGYGSRPYLPYFVQIKRVLVSDVDLPDLKSTAFPL
jgi:hypothetical protein